MMNLRRSLLFVVGLAATAPTQCSSLLSAGRLPLTTGRGTTAGPLHSQVRSSTYVNQLASWRGGAVENVGAGSQPAMNAQLGLVRVAGYGIIAGSLGLKTPQIARVWQAKSLVGLAPASIYADVFLFATSVIYHVLKRNPIRAYGESVVVLVQTMIMVGLMWRYGTEDAALVNADVKSPSAAGIKRSAGGGLVGRSAIVLGSIAATVLCMQYLPPSMWGLLVVISTPTILVVQGPQIYKNWRQKHTGELAPLTVALAFVGSSIRIGTTIADLGADPWLLLNYVLGAVTNATLLVQIWALRARTAEVRRKVEKKTTVAPAADAA